MSRTIRAYAAAAWAVLFALPHLVWTVSFAGIRTSLSDSAVTAHPLGLHLACLAIAVFLLCGAGTALLTTRRWPTQWATLAYRFLLGLTTLGAVLLLARAVDIWLEFSWHLSHPAGIPPADLAQYQALGGWFLLLYGPWFALGGVLWARLAWSCWRSRPVSRRRASAGPV